MGKCICIIAHRLQQVLIVFVSIGVINKHGFHPPTKIMLKVILTSLGGMGVMANLALMAIILIKRPLRR